MLYALHRRKEVIGKPNKQDVLIAANVIALPLSQFFRLLPFRPDNAVGFLPQSLFIVYDGGMNYLEFPGVPSFKGIVKILKSERNDIERTDETVFHLRGQEFLIVFPQCYIMVDTDAHTYVVKNIDAPEEPVALQKEPTEEVFRPLLGGPVTALHGILYIFKVLNLLPNTSWGLLGSYNSL